MQDDFGSRTAASDNPKGLKGRPRERPGVDRSHAGKVQALPIGRLALLAGPVRHRGANGKDVPNLGGVAANLAIRPPRLEASEALEPLSPLGLIEAGNVNGYMVT